MIGSSGIAELEGLLPSWSISKICCFVFYCVYTLSLEALVVVYGFQDVNMTKLQKEPG